MVQYILNVGYLGYVIPAENGERVIKEKGEPIKTLEQIIETLKLKGKIKIKFECPEYEAINELKEILTEYNFKVFYRSSEGTSESTANLPWLEVRKLIEKLLALKESLKKKGQFIHLFLTLTWPKIEVDITDCEYYFSIKASLEILKNLKYELAKDRRVIMHTGKEIELTSL